MSEPPPVPSSTDPTLIGVVPLPTKLAGEHDSTHDTGTAVARTDGWGLAMEAALSQGADPLQLSSQSASTWAEMAAQRQDARLWRLLARTCEEKGEYCEALKYATEALHVQPDEVASLSLLARLHEKQPANGDAVHWHQQVLVHDPTRKTSNRFLAHHYYRSGEYEKALACFTQLLEIEPQLRINKLYYVLTRVKSSGIHGVAKLLADMHRWQQLSPEERALAHELFALVGRRCLQSKQITRATQYLTWAVELLPTPEVEALLADAIAQDPWTAKSSETVASIIKPPVLQEGYMAPRHLPDRRMLLHPIMATFGAAALTIALSLPLFFTQPYGFLFHQAERLAPSGLLPRLSHKTPGALASGPTNQVRELALPSATMPPQNRTTTLPLNANSRARIPPTNKSSTKGTPEPAIASSFLKPPPTSMSKPAVSEQAQHSEEPKRRKKEALSALVVATNNPQPGSDGITLSDVQPRKKNPKQLPSGVEARQPSPAKESAEHAAILPVAQREDRDHKELQPVSEVKPESAEPSPPVELATIASPSPVEQKTRGEKGETVMKTPPLSSPAEETSSAITTIASQLPYAGQFPVREQEFAMAPAQLWPRLKALIEQETEVLLQEDKEQGVLHGTIIQRQLRPRIHTFKPYGHYLVEVIPGTTEGTSLVRAKILTFDWRTRRPAPGAEHLAERFLQKIAGIIN